MVPKITRSNNNSPKKEATRIPTKKINNSPIKSPSRKADYLGRPLSGKISETRITEEDL